MLDKFKVKGSTLFDSNDVLLLKSIKVKNINTEGAGIGFGKTHGYAAAGQGPTTKIHKYGYASDGNSTVVGDLLPAKSGPTQNYNGAGVSSITHGYAFGSYPGSPSGTVVDDTLIQKFPWAITDGTTAAKTGNTTLSGRYGYCGVMSPTTGFIAGGHPPHTKTIQSFPFTTDADATNVGDLISEKYFAAPGVSQTHGFVAGGSKATTGLPRFKHIESFPLSNAVTVSNIGNLTQFVASSQGASSSATHGYIHGGKTIPTPDGVGPPLGDDNDRIEKYSFATSADGVDVGNLTTTRYENAGSSSSTHGYSAGGRNPGLTNAIEKFPFAADTNATDVGDLVATPTSPSGSTYAAAGNLQGAGG